MNLAKLLRACAAVTLLGFAPAGLSVFDPVNDDTDIFLANPAYNATRPNILIFVDNTANWGQAADGADKFTHEKSALAAVIGDLSDEFNVGLAMFTETGGGNSGEAGAYIRYAVRRMTDTNKTRLVNLINNLSENGDKGNAARFSAAMMEMRRYYAGVTAYAGHDKVKRDYAGNTTNNSYAADLAGNAFTSAASSTYVSPITDACQKNFVIFISNGSPNDNSASLAVAESELVSLTGINPPTTISISPNGQQGNWSDEYAKFMANSDCNPHFDGVQNVYTYTLEVVPGTTGQGPATTALLKSMATNGKGKYFAVSGSNTQSQIVAALKSIFNEVQAVNSVFASTTLPVSVNVRGTNLNQVYIGVFRPDANKSPRWLGNLKLYKLGVDTATSQLFLADANGDPAQNSTTGFITGSAVSYWTQASSYWGFRDAELNGVGGASDSPDGDLVEKGGAAQRVRLAYPEEQATRKLYTCVNNALTGLCAPNDALSATPFDNTKVTAADLGAYTTYEVAQLTSTGSEATLVLTAAPNPVWSAGNQIRVEGATPAIYNGTYDLTAADNGTFTYKYMLPSAPDTTGAQATASNHGLQSGDLITISNAGGFNITDATVTRLDQNSFMYTTGGVSGSVSGGISASGKKAVTSLTGTGMTATAVVQAHGYAVNDSITISGADAAFDVFNRTATVQSVSADGNSFTYSTSPSVITGTTTKAQLTTTTAHFIATNQSNVYVVGNSTASYNGGAKTGVTKISDTVLVFDSTEVLSGAGGYIGVRIASFSHPTTGSGNNAGTCGDRDVLTVTTDGAHNLVVPTTAQIEIRGGTGGNGTVAEYNGTWTISSADILSANTFRITQTTTTNSTNALGRICSFDQGPNSAPAMTMVAGKAIGTVGPIVAATGTIRSAKAVNVSSITALTNATGAITAGRLVDGDNTIRDAIIAWVRGADNRDDENPATTPVGGDIRPSVHGDVLHSRPAVINYNRYEDDNDIYAFYGGNDGVFRAVRGGTHHHASGPDASINPGTERWGFIPREFFGKLRRLREQNPQISSANPRDYFADGSVAVYQKDVNNDGKLVAADGDKVFLYVTMRRGGDFIYALDVSDPATPRLLWRKGQDDTGWELLGQTWSEPRVARLQTSLGNAANPDNVVLIFGAGYDRTVEDLNPCLLQSWSSSGVVRKAIGAGTVDYTATGSCTITGATGGTTSFSRTKGRGILVVDAFNGQVLWQAGASLTTSSTAGARKLNVPAMSCAIPSDVAVLDKNRDGYADRAYVGDTCGQVWRLDMSGDMNDWTVTRIAEVSTGADTDIANKRKFLFPPDLVFATDGVGNYTAVLMGSGDREHAFDTIVQNAFYMFKDRDSSDPGNPQAGALNATSVRISGFGTPPTGSPITHHNPDSTGVFDATNVDGANDRGWRINLLGGEKVVSSATTIAGTTFFNTNQPSASAGGGSCGSNLGIAREYLVSFADGAATADRNGSGGITIADRATVHPGGGYLPSPVPVVVEIDGKKYQAVISGTSVQTPPGLTLERRTRSYWYKEVD